MDFDLDEDERIDYYEAPALWEAALGKETFKAETQEDGKTFKHEESKIIHEQLF